MAYAEVDPAYISTDSPEHFYSCLDTATKRLSLPLFGKSELWKELTAHREYILYEYKKFKSMDKIEEDEPEQDDSSEFTEEDMEFEEEFELDDNFDPDYE